jgi:hypothetical protein
LRRKGEPVASAVLAQPPDDTLGKERDDQDE